MWQLPYQGHVHGSKLDLIIKPWYVFYSPTTPIPPSLSIEALGIIAFQRSFDAMLLYT